LLEKADKLNPTAHFPSITIAGNTFGKKCMEESIKPIHTILQSNMPFRTEENLCADEKKPIHIEAILLCKKQKYAANQKLWRAITKTMETIKHINMALGT
jgi:hypothetical protein